MTDALDIQFVTHAAIRIEGGFGALLTDPWILNEPVYNFTTWKFPAATLPPDEVCRGLTHVYFSHAHEDHFHIPSIDTLPRDVEVLIPGFPDHPILRSFTMERVLREMGFSRIRRLAPWQTVALDAETAFTLVPACRTKYWDWENSGFVLEHPAAKVLNLNDCPVDKESCAEIARRFGAIDIAWLQYSGVSMFPGRYRMSEADMRAAAAARKASWVQQSTAIENLEIRAVAPFAGDFAWLDDRLFHCNWANRATPKLFEDFVAETYPERGIDVHILYPGDRWRSDGRVTRTHPPIDWSRYLEDIARLKTALQPKVDAIAAWIDSADVADLEARSRAYTERLNAWLYQGDIDFSVRIRFVVEGPHAGFDFVMKADPEHGFRIDWDDAGPVDQTLFVRQAMWAAIVGGRVMMNTIQWDGLTRMDEDFRIEIARFWFWFELHIDLNNRNAQAAVDRTQFPDREPAIDPGLGVFTLENEWDRAWLDAAVES